MRRRTGRAPTALYWTDRDEAVICQLRELSPRGRRVWVLREAARSLEGCRFDDHIAQYQKERLDRLMYEDFPNGMEEWDGTPGHD